MNNNEYQLDSENQPNQTTQNLQLTDKIDDYKKNFDLIESIMELEKELMQQPEELIHRVELNCINQNVLTNQNNILSPHQDHTNHVNQNYYINNSNNRQFVPQQPQQPQQEICNTNNNLINQNNYRNNNVANYPINHLPTTLTHQINTNTQNMNTQNVSNINTLNNTNNMNSNFIVNVNVNNSTNLVDTNSEIQNKSFNTSFDLKLEGGGKHNTSIDQSVYPYDLEGVNFPAETTEQIAKKIKEMLIESKISQKMLAENLLNMKQANLSPLLSNPKPWKNLTPIIKNRFLVMHLWLNDENRVQKIVK